MSLLFTHKLYHLSAENLNPPVPAAIRPNGFGHGHLFPRCESLIHFSGMPYKKRQPGTTETSMGRIIQGCSAAPYPPGAAECFTLFSLQDYGINMYVIQR